MYFKNICKYLLFSAAGIILTQGSAYSMGANPKKVQNTPKVEQQVQPQESKITLKELAQIYWPDSNATQLQQEETLKNLLGKRVNWEVTVAQIQRDGNGYRIQGQSDKDMLGTFSYVEPTNEAETDKILSASMGSKLDISGIVKDMEMRHIILNPANIVIKGK